MWPPPPPMWPPPPPPPWPPPPPRACAPVARRLPASTALAKIIITRPLMTFSSSLGGIVRHRADAGVSEKMPTSRCIGDGEACLSSLLNSGSLKAVEHLSGSQPKTNPPIGPMRRRLHAHRRSKRPAPRSSAILLRIAQDLRHAAKGPAGI